MQHPENLTSPDISRDTQELLELTYNILDTLITNIQMHHQTLTFVEQAIGQLEILQCTTVELSRRSVHNDLDRGIELPKSCPPGFTVKIEAKRKPGSLDKFQIDGVGPFNEDGTLRTGYTGKYHFVGRSNNDTRPIFDLHLALMPEKDIRLTGINALAKDHYEIERVRRQYSLLPHIYGVPEMMQSLQTLLQKFAAQVPASVATISDNGTQRRIPEHRR